MVYGYPVASQHLSITYPSPIQQLSNSYPTRGGCVKTTHRGDTTESHPKARYKPGTCEVQAKCKPGASQAHVRYMRGTSQVRATPEPVESLGGGRCRMRKTVSLCWVCSQLHTFLASIPPRRAMRTSSARRFTASIRRSWPATALCGGPLKAIT